MKLGLYVGETRDLERSLEMIVEAERRGLHGVWVPGGLALDTLTVLALGAGRTATTRSRRRSGSLSGRRCRSSSARSENRCARPQVPSLTRS